MLYDALEVTGLEFTSQGDVWRVTGVTEDGRNLKGIRLGGTKGELPFNIIEQQRVNQILRQQRAAMTG